MILVFLMCLFPATFCDRDLLRRLDRRENDIKTAENFRSVENLLKNELEKVLSRGPAVLTQRLNSIHVHDDQLSLWLRSLKLHMEEGAWTVSPTLKESLLMFTIQPKKITIDGSYILTSRNRGWDRVTATFRMSVEGLRCSGTSSLVKFIAKLDIGWTFLDCNFTSANITTVKYRVVSKLSHLDDFMNNSFNGFMEKKLKRVIEDFLTKESSSKINRVLPISSEIFSRFIQSSTYRNIIENEIEDANAIVDEIMVVISRNLRIRLNDTVPVPDLQEIIKCSLLGKIGLNTGLTARNGKAHGLSTLSRQGNATLSRRNVTIIFRGILRFKKIHVEYSRFQASLLGFGPSGTLMASAAPVLVGLSLKFDFGTRKIYLDKFRIIEIGLRRVEVRGVDRILDALSSQITNWVLASFHHQVIWVVENRVAQYTRQILDKNTIDSIILGQVNW